jgi:hypothetical protein
MEDLHPAMPSARASDARAWGTALLVVPLWIAALVRAARAWPAPPLSGAAMVAAALAAQALATLGEALALRTAWGALGRRAAVRALAPRLFAASAAEAFAVAVAAGTGALPVGLAVVLAGARAASDAPTGAWGRAWAALGVLTLVRLALSAAAQAEVARVRWRDALVVALVAWLATRLAMWWTLVLLQGRTL